MTSPIKQLNEELYQDFMKNRKVQSQSMFSKLVKLKRLIKKQISKNLCSWCEESVGKFKGKEYVKEYFISGLCQDCQDATEKEAN